MISAEDFPPRNMAIITQHRKRDRRIQHVNKLGTMLERSVSATNGKTNFN
jgi:hypothetical protein